MLRKTLLTFGIGAAAIFSFGSPAGASTETASTLLIEEEGSGFCGVNGWVHDNHPGFTGSGFANTQNILGNGVDYAIYVGAAGNYEFDVRYALGSSNRTAEFQIDGTAHSLTFERTGSWTNYADADTQVLQLSEGVHRLRLEGTNRDALPNVDSLTISGADVQAANCDDAVEMPNLQLLSPTQIPWIGGAQGWANLVMTSTGPVENVAVTVISTTDNVSYAYPANADQSSLSQDARLDTSEVDLASIQFHTTSNDQPAKVEIEIAYDALGKRQTITEVLELSNERYEGEDFAILTETATLTSSTELEQQNWLELEYLGLSPMNSKLQASVEAKFEAYHPQESFTSLHFDERLLGGERDVARVWFDPASLEAGTFTATVTVSYTNTDGQAKTISHDVVVEVI